MRDCTRKNCGVATLTLRISVDSSIMMPIVGDFRICSFIQVRRTCARFIRNSLAGILADILPAEREGRGSEAVHELRNERQLAKRNVLPDVPTSAATVFASCRGRSESDPADQLAGLCQQCRPKRGR